MRRKGVEKEMKLAAKIGMGMGGFMRNGRMVASIGAGVLVMFGALHGQEAGAGAGGGDRQGEVDEVLGLFDLNGDGKLSGDEVEGVKKLYGKIPGFLEDYVFEANWKTAMRELDVNRNGVLDEAEVEKAVQWVKDNPEIGGRGGRGGRGPGGPRGFRPGGGEAEAPIIKPGVKVEPSEVAKYPDHGLYDTSVLRTLFLTIPVEDWEPRMAALKDADLEIGAKLEVDGKVFPQVGIRFRGNTSFRTVSDGKKRSININLDAVDKKADLYGYQTVELLNAHTDASFLRQATFNYVAGHLIPAPKTNFVHLVINGESWGIYTNVQQFNKDFLKEHFQTKKGIRLKVPANPRGGRSLSYLGDDLEVYRSNYEIKTSDDDESWKLFVGSLKQFNEAVEAGDFELADKYLDIDMALYYMALENLFIDNDGYWVRSSDFNIYVDTSGRIYTVLRDANETFKAPGGPGFSGGQNSRFGISPYHGEDEENKVLAYHLFKDKRMRARYAAHYRSIANQWLSWDAIEPVITKFHEMIKSVVLADTRKLYGNAAFLASIDGESDEAATQGGPFGRSSDSFKKFIDERSISLIDFPELDASPIMPEGISVMQLGQPVAPGQPLQLGKDVTVSMELRSEDAASLDKVHLYVSGKTRGGFKRIPMTIKHGAEAHQFSADIDLPASSHFKIYFEMDAIESSNVTHFFPRLASLGAMTWTTQLPDNPEEFLPELKFAGVMPSNATNAANQSGKFADWFAIKNYGDEVISLDGYYVSDSKKKLKKWAFPDGVTVKPGRSIRIWADGRLSNQEELHTSFKLSRKGESLYLVAPDYLGNRVVDSISWKNAQKDILVSWE